VDGQVKGARDLLASERGAFCCLALVAITVLASLRIIGGDDALSFIRYLLALLVGSKTITTAVETWTTKQPQIPRAEVVNDR
jgi:hypothetical protein